MGAFLNIVLFAVACSVGVTIVGYWFSFWYNKSDGELWGLGVTMFGFVSVVASLVWLVTLMPWGI